MQPGMHDVVPGMIGAMDIELADVTEANWRDVAAIIRQQADVAVVAVPMAKVTASPDELVRAILLLRARSLAQGHSGVRPLIVERLLEMLDRDILPVIPSQGSVGASGDLAPFAHMALPVIGFVVAGQLKEQFFGFIVMEVFPGIGATHYHYYKISRILIYLRIPHGWFKNIAMLINPLLQVKSALYSHNY